MMRGWKILGCMWLKCNEINVFICCIVNLKLIYYFSKFVGILVSIYLIFYV